VAKLIGVALAAACGVAFATPPMAATVRAIVFLASPKGVGGPAGRVVFRDAPGGATIRIALYRLSPGQHGIHIHDNPSCAAGPVDGVWAAAGAAGGHYDPAPAGMYGAEGNGKLGDLPDITVNEYGSDHETLRAPSLTDVRSLEGHSVVIHAGGDDPSDHPRPPGGVDGRIACGVIG
jgi:Cu-Zn family superoxide dismutase